MKVSIITPCFNSARFLEQCITRVLGQRDTGADLEYIVVDGGSTDGSRDIIERYRPQIDQVIIEPDRGPADAINKGMARATGDVLAWLNADDYYLERAVSRAATALKTHPRAAFCFGQCPMVDENDRPVRAKITQFKRQFFRISSRFTFQCINYISQPSLFFRRSAWEAAGPLRLDLKAAWDYEWMLRLHRVGPGTVLRTPPLAVFRRHAESISSQTFELQFDEEYRAARDDAGYWSPQTFLHWWVKWGIILSYRRMAANENRH